MRIFYSNLISVVLILNAKNLREFIVDGDVNFSLSLRIKLKLRISKENKSRASDLY